MGSPERQPIPTDPEPHFPPDLSLVERPPELDNPNRRAILRKVDMAFRDAVDAFQQTKLSKTVLADDRRGNSWTEIVNDQNIAAIEQALASAHDAVPTQLAKQFYTNMGHQSFDLTKPEDIDIKTI